MGNVDNWRWLEVSAMLLSVVIALILGFIGLSWARQKGLRRVVSLGVVIVCTLYLISVVGFATQLYSLWKDNPLGKFLLPPHSGYYYLAIGEFTRPYLIYILAGIGAGLIFWVLRLISRGRMLTSSEIGLVFLLGLMFGINVVFIILTGMVLAALWVGIRKETRVSITPFLILASYIILVAGI